MTFTVTIDPATLSRSRRSSITGVLFVVANGTAFPEKGWSDLPVVVLGWWARAVREVLHGAREGVCLFMDGPFSFSVQASSNRAWTVQLLGGEGEPTATVETSPQEVAGAVAGAAEAVLAACAANGWTSSDIDELSRAVAELRKG
jgi:hypothetical protein